MPAGLAGPLSSTPATSAPRVGLTLRLSAISSVTCWMRTPSQPRRVSPNSLQLVDHRHRGLRRHREADADRTAGRRDDRGVDADHLAFEVEQRPARVAAIDGGVGLDVVVVGARLDVAIARRHDAGRHGAAEAERIADGHHPFAEPQLFRIAEFHRLERLLGLDPQQRDVGLLILADQFRLQTGTVVEDHGDLVGLGDHVVVGDHDAGGIDHEAGTERIHPPRDRCGSDCHPADRAD